MKKIDNTIVCFISNTAIMIALIVLSFFLLWDLMASIIYKIFLIIFIPLLNAFLVEKILSRCVNAAVSFFLEDEDNK